jgi:glycine cleavage system H protein
MDLNENGCFEFAMGDFSAEFPTDRSYAKNHMWASQVQPQGEPSRWRFGLTAYAVRLLQDVYFLDWLVEPVAAIESRAHIGSIESKKAESDLFAPLEGKLVAINETALSDPSIINADCYGEGWMIEMTASQDASAVLLDPEGYAEHLVKAWDVAQKTIKGQANT